MRSREELLSSIQPGMRLTWEFMKRIYGYELTWPGFADIALTALEKAGCSRAREYYMQYVRKYEAWYADEMKGVSEWLRRQQNAELRPRKMSNSELLSCMKQLREVLKIAG